MSPSSKPPPSNPSHTQQIFTEISFDVPSNGANYCQLAFTISTDPTRSAPWTLWGVAPYRFNISSLPPTINKDTDTWNNRPQPIEWVATVELDNQGNTKVFSNGVVCAKGQVAQFLLYPENPERDFGLVWFELTDPLHGITYEMYD